MQQPACHRFRDGRVETPKRHEIQIDREISGTPFNTYGAEKLVNMLKNTAARHRFFGGCAEISLKRKIGAHVKWASAFDIVKPKESVVAINSSYI